jgi:cytochrome c oxidase cbb3-type subunit 2
MSLYEKPAIFAVAAAVVVSVGTLATTFIPLFMPSTQPVKPYVTPYRPVELEGRDIYIREGCNNCHTQTVRPLRAEVARYGEFSRPEESAFDRPFLWGSRRTGPDLARVGGKYPDSWHYRHMADPRGMFDKSNMPPYAWLAGRKLDTSLTARKVRVLGMGDGGRETAGQVETFRRHVTAPVYPSGQVRAAVTPAALRGEVTEMDALVAYLQKLGRDLKEREKKPAPRAVASKAAAANPYAGSPGAAARGEEIFEKNCRGCHGEKGRGGIGPDLSRPKKYGNADADLYATVSGGRPGGMPPFEGTLGKDRIWKAVSYVRSLERR